MVEGAGNPPPQALTPSDRRSRPPAITSRRLPLPRRDFLRRTRRQTIAAADAISIGSFGPAGPSGAFLRSAPVRSSVWMTMLLVPPETPGVTVAGVNVTLAPSGRPVAERVTGRVKFPSADATLIW